MDVSKAIEKEAQELLEKAICNEDDFAGEMKKFFSSNPKMNLIREEIGRVPVELKSIYNNLVLLIGHDREYCSTFGIHYLGDNVGDKCNYIAFKILEKFKNLDPVLI